MEKKHIIILFLLCVSLTAAHGSSCEAKEGSLGRIGQITGERLDRNGYSIEAAILPDKIRAQTVADERTNPDGEIYPSERANPATWEDRTDETTPAKEEDRKDETTPAKGEDQTDETTPADGEDQTDGTTPTDGEEPEAAPKEPKYTLKVKNGNTYCLDEKGKKVKKKLVEVKGAFYYFDKNGLMVQGWKKIGKEYYYFKRTNGKMVSGKKVDGIKLKKDGKAKKSAANLKKIKTMIKAQEIVNEITDPTDKKADKVKKCFQWVQKFPYRRYRTIESAKKETGWEATFANDIFDKKAGCCVSQASALAFLFRECGYEEVYLCDDTSHGWVELDGRVYDPLFAKTKGLANYYNVSYKTYKLSPVGRVKI